MAGDKMLILPDKGLTLEDGPQEGLEIQKRLTMPSVRMSFPKYISISRGAKTEGAGISWLHYDQNLKQWFFQSYHESGA